MAQTPWLLKVLAGSHAGVELELSEPEYLLGSDEQCDLVFHDRGFAPRHLQIRLDDDGVRVQRLDTEQPVSIDGRPLEAAEVVLQPFQTLSIGALRFAMAPVGAALGIIGEG